MNIVLYRALAAASMGIVAYATSHLVMAGGPRGAPNFLQQMDAALAFLLAAAYFICRQRETDWMDQPKRLRKLWLAKRMLGGATLLYVLMLGFNLYDRFWGPHLGT